LAFVAVKAKRASLRNMSRKAIHAVCELYSDFLKEFGSTDCKTLSHCDWSEPEELNRYIQNKGWKNTCDIFLKFVVNKCIELAEKEKL
jgi:hypothetical protein